MTLMLWPNNLLTDVCLKQVFAYTKNLSELKHQLKDFCLSLNEVIFWFNIIFVLMALLHLKGENTKKESYNNIALGCSNLQMQKLA